jgi:hypothetical protein
VSFIVKSLRPLRVEWGGERMRVVAGRGREGRQRKLPGWRARAGSVEAGGGVAWGVLVAGVVLGVSRVHLVLLLDGR